jgi:DNA repair exonuclease SbcCD ATPase subunit
MKNVIKSLKTENTSIADLRAAHAALQRMHQDTQSRLEAALKDKATLEAQVQGKKADLERVEAEKAALKADKKQLQADLKAEQVRGGGGAGGPWEEWGGNGVTEVTLVLQCAGWGGTWVGVCVGWGGGGW